MNKEQLYGIFSVIPLNGKVPKLKKWQEAISDKIIWDKIKDHEGNIGIVCGFEGLEVIDIDNHFGDADILLSNVRSVFDVSGCVLIKTGGGGYHIYYRCEEIEASQKLAMRVNKDKKPEVLIETRGKGGQVVFYSEILEGDLKNIRVLSIEEREEILNACRSLNEIDPTPERKNKKTKEEDKPGTQYIEDPGSIEETKALLKQAGWSELNDKYWRRPGKKTGVSATFGKVGINKFYVFSSNAYPFEDRQSYTMFGVRAMLMHGGSYENCAKELSEKYKKPKQKPKSKDKWETLKSIIKDWNLKFRLNELTQVFEVSRNGSDYKKAGLIYGDIIMEMETKRGVKSISKSKLDEMICNSTFCELYNPIANFIKSIPAWDKKDNFKELCKYIELASGEKQEFFESMLKKHFVRILRCAIEKDYVNRISLIFHGPQNIGKSYFFRWITNDEIYNEDPIRTDNKDSILALGRYLLINLDDLDELNKTEVGKLKSFISRGTVTQRVAYGRHDEKFNRIASFVGSTNKSDILSDETNTRWVILKTKSFNWQEYIKKINPMQLWAEAIEMYKNDPLSGELTTVECSEREQRNNVQFLETSMERELLERHFTETTGSYMNATDVQNIIITNFPLMKINFYKLTRELRRVFGEAQPHRYKGKQGRYYMISHDLYTNVPNPVAGEIAQENLPF